jgi:hypothetical protein
MNEQELQDMLQGIIDTAIENALMTDDDDMSLSTFEEARYTTSFENAGVLTDNKGLIIKMTDGSEFQLTIVKSR